VFNIAPGGSQRRSGRVWSVQLSSLVELSNHSPPIQWLKHSVHTDSERITLECRARDAKEGFAFFILTNAPHCSLVCDGTGREELNSKYFAAPTQSHIKLFSCWVHNNYGFHQWLDY
jgi:hypothetical protein